MADVPDHFFTQSAVLPFHRRQGKLEILMITSRGRKRWVIPKGVHEPDLSASESAAKEAMEEAGIEGDISANPLGTYRYAKWGGVCTVTVFAMEVRTVHEKWPESFRDRQWLSAVEAAARATEPALKKMILELDAGDVTPVS